MLPFAWGSWNCLLPEICGLGFGRERADPREKISFSKLFESYSVARKNSSDQVDRGKSQGLLLCEKWKFGSQHGGWARQVPGFGPQDAARVAGSGSPEKGPQKAMFLKC